MAYRADEFEFYLSDLGARAVILPAGAASPARDVATRLGVRLLELQEAQLKQLKEKHKPARPLPARLQAATDRLAKASSLNGSPSSVSAAVSASRWREVSCKMGSSMRRVRLLRQGSSQSH